MPFSPRKGINSSLVCDRSFPNITFFQLLGPAQIADTAFKISRLGDWMFQCHFLDHVMNPVSKEIMDEMREDASISPIEGLMAFVRIRPGEKAGQDFQPAGLVTQDPACVNPSRR